MKILENKINKIVLENNDYIYLISYNSIIARCSNVMDYKNNRDVELILTDKWDYSITTLKQLYDYLDLYCMLRLEDYNDNLLNYELNRTKNKKQFLQNLIDKNIIKIEEL